MHIQEYPVSVTEIILAAPFPAGIKTFKERQVGMFLERFYGKFS